MWKRSDYIPVAVVLMLVLFSCAGLPRPLDAGTGPAREGKTPGGQTQAAGPKETKEQPWDRKPSVTRHTIRIHGVTLSYTATAGYMPLSDEKGKPAAYMFYVAYTKDPPPDPTGRPITFAFNGGPGAASVWLHMAALGPQRVVLSDGGRGLPAPYHWTANEETWLEFTDLVFIDPVGTGFSRPAEGTKPEDFLGVQKDIESVGQFIRLYVTRNERWLSPRFLAGESYGTTRAAGLSKHLQDKVGMGLSGILLMSTVLNFQTISSGPDNDLAYALLLPAYTAAAAYHKRLPPALQTDPAGTRAAVESFSLREYLPALAMGHALPSSEREALIRRLADYTGLTPLTIRNSNLRVDMRTFTRRLLEDRNLRLGLYDSRLTADYGYRSFMEDPSIFETTAPMLSACNDYLRRALKWETDLPYDFLSDKAHREWKWGSADDGYVDKAPTLAMALDQNRFLRVFVAAGMYDLVTPYFAALYTCNRMGPDTDQRSRITLEYYEGGHQVYMDRKSRQKLRDDSAAFYRRALASE